ncbi:MAG: hypothetical protein ABFR65_08870 [Pseudomonadota bacterium]
MKFETINAFEILSYGVIGLGFLLAVLSYLLLLKEQKLKDPRPPMLHAINRFMMFSIVLCSIGIASEIAKGFSNNSSGALADKAASFDSIVADLRKTYAHDSKPENFRKGSLNELEQATLVLKFPRGRCEDYLVATEPKNEIDISWYTNGAGARNVRVTKSGAEHFKTGSICTSEKKGGEASIGLIVKMIKGSGMYAAETYFASQIVSEGFESNESPNKAN